LLGLPEALKISGAAHLLYTTEAFVLFRTRENHKYNLCGRQASEKLFFRRDVLNSSSCPINRLPSPDKMACIGAARFPNARTTGSGVAAGF